MNDTPTKGALIRTTRDTLEVVGLSAAEVTQALRDQGWAEFQARILPGSQHPGTVFVNAAQVVCVVGGAE